MICILTTFVILLRCMNSSYRVKKKSVRLLWANNGSPRSIVHQFIRLPLLRRPSFINVPFWVAWWVCAYNGSPRPIVFLCLQAPRRLIFMSGFPQAFCLGNSIPWIPADSIVTVITFTESKNVFRRFLLHSSKIVCLFRTWSFTRFTNDLDSTHNSNAVVSLPMMKFWEFASSWKSISGRPDLSRGVSSFITDCAVPSWRVSSWEKTRSNFSCRSPTSFIRSPRSLVCLNISFPLLRRPGTVVIPLWVACWRETFHKLLMIIVVGSFQSICADNRSSRSLLFLSNCTPGILISITCLPGFTEVEDDTCDGALAIRFIIVLDFAVTRSSPDSCWARFAIAAVQAVELKWLILNKHNKWFHSSRVKFPLVRTSASWFFGVDVLDLDLWFQIDSIEQPIKRNSVGPGNMSHCGTSSLDHWFVVLKHIQQSFLMRRLDVWGNTVNIIHNIEQSSRLLAWLVICVPVLSWFWVVFPRTKTIRSHKSRAGNPSNLNPASQEMMWDSVELCDTEVCFLHIQLMGTIVWFPKTHNVPPDVDFQSSRSPAKSASWNSPSLYYFAVLLTWQYCL